MQAKFVIDTPSIIPTFKRASEQVIFRCILNLRADAMRDRARSRTSLFKKKRSRSWNVTCCVLLSLESIENIVSWRHVIDCRTANIIIKNT